MANPLNRQTLNGIWHALIVPWTASDELDEARFAKEIQSYRDTGLHGMYTGGTTGEFYAMDDDTFERVTAIACEQSHNLGLPIQIGCTTLSTRTARQRIRIALKHGADGIQIAWPFWLEMRPVEIIQFIRDMADEAGDMPLIVYHTLRTKCKLNPQQIGELANEVPTFIGMKDTGCDLDTLKAMVDAAPDIAIFGGDHDLIKRLPIGGRGGYCSVTGLNAKLVTTIYELVKVGRLEEAAPLQEAVSQLVMGQLVPMVTERGLMDSALDRLMRTIGGGDVGLQCQKPYESCTENDVLVIRQWCEENAPVLLQPVAASS